MQVAALYAASQTQFIPELETTSRNKTRAQAQESRGDTVQFSEEARALAAAMSQRGVEEDQAASPFEREPQADSEQGEDSAKTSQALPGSAEDTANKLSKVQSQIEKLGQQIQAILAGPGTPQEKMAKTQPLEERMHELMQEALDLERQAREQAMTSSGQV